MNPQADDYANSRLQADINEATEEIIALMMTNLGLHQLIAEHPRAFRKNSAIRRQIRDTAIRCDYLQWEIDCLRAQIRGQE